MARKPRLTKQNGRSRVRRQKQYVPGYGGMVGRGLHFVSKTFTNKGSVANKALALARKVANMVNVEYKYFDLTSLANTMNTGSTYGTINLIPQGVGESQRVGDSLKIQNLTMRFNIQRTTADCFARVMLIWDKQNSTTSGSDVITGLSTLNATNGPKNYDKRFQTQVLYDKVFNINANHPQQYEDIVLQIDQHTQYVAASTTVNTGALKLLYLSNIAAGATCPNMNYYARMTYTDD